MKKTVLIPVAVILAALLVLAGTVVFLLAQLPKLTSAGTETTAAPSGDAAQRVEAYVAAQRPDLTFVSCDGAVLTLQYPLNASYAQLEKHGAAAGYGDLADDNLFSAQLLLEGCTQSCGVTLREVVIIGLSSDGQEAYRASTVGGVTACWD